MSIILTDSLGNEKAAPRNAQMSTKIYFWHNPRTDHILQGAPPRFDSLKPPGYLTVECNHAYEAESWSARLHEQDKRVKEMTEFERLQFEKPMIANLRHELETQLRNIEKNKNKAAAAALLKIQLKKLEEYEAKFYSKYESFMHVEAFEHGK